MAQERRPLDANAFLLMVALTALWGFQQVTIKWIASSYPNRVGTSEKRTYKVTGDELTAVNPTAASGGVSYTKSVRLK